MIILGGAKIKLKNFINHSGGAIGSDMAWENIGYEYGVKTMAYSFSGHMSDTKNPVILGYEELNKADVALFIANKRMRRSVPPIDSFVGKLLRRNWHQVINSEAIFAIGEFSHRYVVGGGTGWAVQMAIDSKKPVHLFELRDKQWFTFNNGRWDKEEIPILTKNFAGIGTRKISKYGLNAIKDVYQMTALSLEE